MQWLPYVDPTLLIIMYILQKRKVEIVSLLQYVWDQKYLIACYEVIAQMYLYFS